MAVGPAGGCPTGGERALLLQLVNDARAAGRTCGATSYDPAPPVSWNCQLESAARAHSVDMGTWNFFSHTGSNGSSAGQRVTAAGYVWQAVAENIAAARPASSLNATAVVAGWLNSPGHCANIMNPNFVHMGVAYSLPTNVDWDIYWTQKFARPMP